MLLALTAFVAALGLLAMVSHMMPVDDSADSVMLLMGLAVGVDYCLFYLRREREERAAGRGQGDGVEVAAATSGRSVLISGLTVMVAMAGMFLSGMHIFEGFALATILVVAIAMLGSVTVLPALLSHARRQDRARPAAAVPAGAARRASGPDGGRVWNAVLRPGRWHHPGSSPRWPPGCWSCWPSRRSGCTLRSSVLNVNQLLPASSPIWCRPTTRSTPTSPAARRRTSRSW